MTWVTNVRTADEALVYLIDCTLATVAHMALLKRLPAYEFQRQIGIAQKGMQWAVELQAPLSGRPKDVYEKFGGNVTKWSNDFIARRVK